VTLGVFLRGRCPASDVVPYVLAQLAAAVAAAFAVRIITSGASIPAITIAPGPAFVAEFLFTFALVYVILNVATAKGTAGNSFYGLAIGFTVMAGAFAVGPVSGGAFNPAVAVGASVMNIISWSSLWLYLVADLAGGAAAALTFNALDLGES
jgi:aquaporin Z